VVTEGPLQTTVEIGTEFLVRRPGRGREGANDEVAPDRQQGEPFAAQVAKTALDAMADDGVPDGAADDEAHAGEPAGLTTRLDEQVHHECSASAPAPRARDEAQVIAPSEAMLRWEHGREGTGPGRAATQTARFLRPLRRRADRIDRPARVRMRSRNPCVL
jgi:hypothetical protein